MCFTRFQTTNPARGRKLKPFPYGHSGDTISNHKPRKGTETYLIKRIPSAIACNFKLQTPQGDGNTQDGFNNQAMIGTISNYKPRKGTETVNIDFDICVFRNILNYKPRKGTETPSQSTGTAQSHSNFKLQTPQGDGNSPKTMDFPALFLSYFKLQTPQGDGNLILIILFTWPSTTISNHKPRKGTETSRYKAVFGGFSPHFKPQTPQGDGNTSSTGRKPRPSPRISNHKPRKGTETAKRDRRCITAMIWGISNHKPRKGTETRSMRFSFRAPSPFQTTNPARGRKLVEHEPLSIGLDISKHEPRKGTEAIYNFPPFIYSFSAFQNTNPGRGGTGYDFLLMKSQPVVYVLSLQCILLMLN